MLNHKEMLYKLVRDLPVGNVMTYGQLAMLVGRPNGARWAAKCMANCPDGLPAHRVIRSDGGLAPEHVFGPGVQMRRLLAEGVIFRPNGKVDIKKSVLRT